MLTAKPLPVGKCAFAHHQLLAPRPTSRLRPCLCARSCRACLAATHTPNAGRQQEAHGKHQQEGQRATDPGELRLLLCTVEHATNPLRARAHSCFITIMVVGRHAHKLQCARAASIGQASDRQKRCAESSAPGARLALGWSMQPCQQDAFFATPLPCYYSSCILLGIGV